MDGASDIDEETWDDFFDAASQTLDGNRQGGAEALSGAAGIGRFPLLLFGRHHHGDLFPSFDDKLMK